ncbi:actin cytoskeleton and mitosis protein [Malassezia caprae]|uniref:Actin cytoskeleton and mitosis protein n=1 Tax=Malassezia caprae TaxID=1381934 RepID=A0AAF0E5S7_9BASI|nr:actin cytoskeleton and mitosis protein [Malassezia caprae]
MDGGVRDERRERFRPREDAAASRLAELKVQYAQKREEYIASGVLPDPSKPGLLEDATKLVGTCPDMCPEYERVEREVQKELDRLECFPGTTSADPAAAVKIYRRPAAGRELPLPEEVRPPPVLQRTLDYLVHTLLPADPRDQHFAVVQPFMWNRTRAIRQDFIVQSDRGAIAIACHERIARYHILCLHWKGGVGADAWSEQQELEQLRKTLRSLIEFYDDQRLLGHTYPNEPEFRGYNLLLHARDPETLREVELLPTDVFTAPLLQWALRLRTLLQRSNLLEKRGQPQNTEATPHFFTRFFKDLARPEVSYLMACLAENLFASVRIGAVKTLTRAYLPQHNGLPLLHVTSMLGMDDQDEARSFLELLHVQIGDDDSVKINKSSVLDEDKSFASPFSHTLVESKRGDASCQAIIDGLATTAPRTQPPRTASHLVPQPSPRPAAPAERPAPASLSAFARAPMPAWPAAPAPAPMPAPPVAASTPAAVSAPSMPIKPMPAPRPASPAPVLAPPPPAKPQVPRDRLAKQLAMHLCEQSTKEAVHEVAYSAMSHESRRRAQRRRAALIETLASRLCRRLVAEPSATCVRRAAMEALATAQLAHTRQRAAWKHWRAMLAQVREQQRQSARLEAIRACLPHLQPSRLDKHVHRPVRAPRLWDDERHDTFSRVQHASSRLWVRGSMARALVDRVSWLCEETMTRPLFWTAAVYVEGDGVGSRWLRHKMALGVADSIYTLPQGTQVRIVDGTQASDTAQSPQLVVCEAGVRPPVPTQPTALLELAWNDTKTALHEPVWTPRTLVSLDDAEADADALFADAVEQVVTSLPEEWHRPLALCTSMQPLWDAWLDISDGFDAWLARTSSPAVAHDAFAVLTSLANLLLRLTVASESLTLPMPSVVVEASVSDTLAQLALHQLRDLPWGDPDAKALLRAHTLEHAQSSHVQIGTYMQSLLRMALAHGNEAGTDISVTADSLADLRSLGARALTELAARVDAEAPAPVIPARKTSTAKRTITPPSHAAKRGREDGASTRIQRLLAQSAQLLQETHFSSVDWVVDGRRERVKILRHEAQVQRLAEHMQEHGSHAWREVSAFASRLPFGGNVLFAIKSLAQGCSSLLGSMKAPLLATAENGMIILVGVLIGINMAIISVVSEWASDLKQGYCAGGWWLNKKFCCWEEMDPAGPGNAVPKGIAAVAAAAAGNMNVTSIAAATQTATQMSLRAVEPTLPSSSGISEIKCVIAGFNIQNFLSNWTLVIKSLGLPLAIASGLSVGKEGPAVHVACCMGMAVTGVLRWLVPSHSKLREVLIASSAAGVAVAFGSPIGGVLFALEEMTTSFPSQTMWRTFLCALASTVALSFMNPFRTGKLVLFQVEYNREWHYFEIVFFLLIGILGGLYGDFWLITVCKKP